MLFEFIQRNFVTLALTLFLILFILTNNNFEKRANVLFVLSALCVLVLTFTEAWEAHLALSETYTPLRVLLSAIGYSLRPMIPYLMVLILKPHSKRQWLLLTLPLGVNILISFSALISPIAFGYTQSNEFIRGPIGFIPFLTAAFYIAVLLYVTFKAYKNDYLMETMIISAIVLLAFVTTIMESRLGFRFIQNPCIATSITFYYMFLHTHQNNRDSLTGAMTRRRFYLDANKYFSSLSAVISLDVNDLKQLNDSQGHVAGDGALCAVADIIRHYMGKHATLYRTGGDEFMVLCYKMSEAKVQLMIEGIAVELAQSAYNCAIGYALNDGEQSLDTLCQRADHTMYQNKRLMKQAVIPDC